MATPVIMPKVGISVESCIITKWHKKKGEAVRKGDLLFSYETDKATAEEEAQEDGVLLDIFVQEGDEVPVLAPVGVIGEPGEQVLPVHAGAKTEPPAEHMPEVKTQVEMPAMPVAGTNEGESKVSPRARALAHKAGIDPHRLSGTGPRGRLIERDVRTAMRGGAAGSGIGGRVSLAATGTALEQPENSAAITRLSGVRRAIAKSMTQSLSTMAQLTNHHSFDATAILQYRATLKGSADPALAGITLNDIILYAVARTLKNHRDLNAHLVGDEMHHYTDVHLGVAVDTPRGLLVPTLFSADAMTLVALSAEAKRLAREAQAGTVAPDTLRGGTFTVTNLGTLGVESFTPVINPPQTGILGVCAIVERMRTVEGAVQAYPAMGLSLTYDHRAVDGAPAARFVQELKENLENFTAFLAR